MIKILAIYFKSAIHLLLGLIVLDGHQSLLILTLSSQDVHGLSD